MFPFFLTSGVISLRMRNGKVKYAKLVCPLYKIVQSSVLRTNSLIHSCHSVVIERRKYYWRQLAKAYYILLEGLYDI